MRSWPVIGTVEVCGQRFTIVRRKMHDYGCCKPKQATIEISEGLDALVEKDTIFHETMHAVWEASGADAFAARFVPDATEREAMEEGLIRILTPHLLRARDTLKMSTSDRAAESVVRAPEVKCWCGLPATNLWQEVGGQVGCCGLCLEDARKKGYLGGRFTGLFCLRCRKNSVGEGFRLCAGCARWITGET